MMASSAAKKVLLWVWGIFLGIALGLLTTLIFVTVVRAVLSSIFGWGDSGPDWLYGLLLVITIATLIIACFITTKWSINSIRGYLHR
jgi:hypothetical protein